MNAAGPGTVLACERDLARVCHELRGALGVIRCAVELGRRIGGLGPEQLGVLDLEVGRAAVALEDLEGAGRGGMGEGARSQTLELGLLVAEVTESVRAEGLAAGVPIIVRPGPAIVLKGDRRRLGMALRNVLANAVEHGGGEVSVGWRCSGDAVRITVEDRGPGLARPINVLLDAGAEGRGPRGHGLHIAADALRRHGGRLTSAPTPCGARVVLELPVPAGAAHARASAASR